MLDIDDIRVILGIIIRRLENGFASSTDMSKMIRLILDSEERDNFLEEITSLIEPTTISLIPVEEWERNFPFAEWYLNESYGSYEEYVVSETSCIGPIQHRLRETLRLAALTLLIKQK